MTCVLSAETSYSFRRYSEVEVIPGDEPSALTLTQIGGGDDEGMRQGLDGADPNVGRPLPRILKELNALSANPNPREAEADRIEFLAEAVNALVVAGAELNEPGVDGGIPVELALDSSRLTVLEAIVQPKGGLHGADVYHGGYAVREVKRIVAALKVEDAAMANTHLKALKTLI